NKETVARLAPAIERRGNRDMINVAVADSIFARTTDTAKVRRKPEGMQPAPLLERPAEEGRAAATAAGLVPGSLDDIRRRQAEAKLEDQHLALAAKKGRTRVRDEVCRAAAAAGYAIRTGLKKRNHSLATKLAVMKDAREIAVLLDE